MKNKALASIVKQNNNSHIIGEEYQNVYYDYDTQIFLSDIETTVIADFENFINLNDFEMEGFEYREIQAMRKGEAGFYIFNCGDYTYYVTIF